MLLDHINLTVTNLEASVAWYKRVFGFKCVEVGLYQGKTPWAIIQHGEALLALYEAPARRVPDDFELERVGHHGIAHFGLRITDEQAWLSTVEREQVRVDHTWRYPHSKSWYVVDPSGWEIEVALWDDGKVSFH